MYSSLIKHFPVANVIALPGVVRSMLLKEKESSPARVGSPALTLNVGAGTGLLSMMAARAARAGAHSVLACERDLSLALSAWSVVNANGCGGVVEVVNEDTRGLVVGAEGHMKRRWGLVWASAFRYVFQARSLLSRSCGSL